MRRLPRFVLLIVAISAAAIGLIPSAQKANSGRPGAANKKAAPLRLPANYDRSDSERVRVIVKAADGIQPNQIYARLQAAGANIGHQMDALGRDPVRRRATAKHQPTLS